MVANVSGKSYEVSFQYGEWCWNDKVTYCFVYDAAGVQVAEGTASCHPNDRFNKVVGRKLALARALKNAGLDKGQRTEIWNQYKATHKYVS